MFAGICPAISLEKGFKGDRGLPGSKGEPGDKGSIGQPGDKGDHGTMVSVINILGESDPIINLCPYWYGSIRHFIKKNYFHSKAGCVSWLDPYLSTTKQKLKIFWII